MSRTVMLFLLIWPLLAWCGARALILESGISEADAIVVLGGAATYIERSRHAAMLYHEGRAPFIILTNDGMPGGWSEEKGRTVYFIERAAEELVLLGVPAEKIRNLASPLATGTYEEAEILRDYASAYGLKSLLVVTSAYHSRRAMWAWQRVFSGSSVDIGISAVNPGMQSPRASLWWLTRAGWEMVAGEYLKFGYYLLRYRSGISS